MSHSLRRLGRQPGLGGAVSWNSQYLPIMSPRGAPSDKKTIRCGAGAGARGRVEPLTHSPTRALVGDDKRLIMIM